MWLPQKSRKFPTEDSAFSRTRPDNRATRTRARPRSMTARSGCRRKCRQERQQREKNGGGGDRAAVASVASTWTHALLHSVFLCSIDYPHDTPSPSAGFRVAGNTEAHKA